MTFDLSSWSSKEASKLPGSPTCKPIENRYNEYVMTGLRTIWGVSLKKIEIEFGTVFQSRLLQNADKYLKTNFLKIENLHLKATGIIDGDVFYRNIIIESGGILKSQMVQNMSKINNLFELNKKLK